MAFIAVEVLKESKKNPSLFSINKPGEVADPKKNSPRGFAMMLGIMAVIFYFGIGFWLENLFKDDPAPKAAAVPTTPIEQNNTPSESSRVKAGQTIRFSKAGIACDQHDTLVDAMVYGANNDADKFNKLFKPSPAHGTPHCLMLNEKLLYKVMTVEQHENVGFALIEIKLPDIDMDHGLWATDVGIVIVEPT